MVAFIMVFGYQYKGEKSEFQCKELRSHLPQSDALLAFACFVFPLFLQWLICPVPHVVTMMSCRNCKWIVVRCNSIETFDNRRDGEPCTPRCPCLLLEQAGKTKMMSLPPLTAPLFVQVKIFFQLWVDGKGKSVLTQLKSSAKQAMVLH